MYSKCLHTNSLQTFRKLYTRNLIHIPANSHFYGNRLFHTLNNRLAHFHCMIDILHQGTSGKGFHDFCDRAAHIDINNITSCFFIEKFCGIYHRFNIMSENLHCQRMLLFLNIRHSDCFFIIIIQRLIRNHLRINKPCAEFLADYAKGRIGNPGHRCDHYTVGNHNISDFPAVIWHVSL